MIGERHTTWRWTTTKRLDRPWLWRCSSTLANRRCEVELPMSMPMVESSTFSWFQMVRAISARSSSDIVRCS